MVKGKGTNVIVEILPQFYFSPNFKGSTKELKKSMVFLLDHWSCPLKAGNRHTLFLFRKVVDMSQNDLDLYLVSVLS